VNAYSITIARQEDGRLIFPLPTWVHVGIPNTERAEPAAEGKRKIFIHFQVCPTAK
jgi:hypothetical protein